MQQTRRERIKLEKHDLDALGDIVSSYGIKIDEEFLESIANHLEDFTKVAIVILGAAN